MVGGGWVERRVMPTGRFVYVGVAYRPQPPAENSLSQKPVSDKLFSAEGRVTVFSFLIRLGYHTTTRWFDCS